MNNNKLKDWDPNLYQKKHDFVYKYGEDLIELLDPKKDERILDLGCGTGQLTSFIASKAKNVVGIDSSRSMILDAKKTYPKPEFCVADIANFKLSKKFDAIFSNAALHWVSNYKGAIKSMYNHLKIDGKLVIEFGGKDNVKTIIDALRMVLTDKGFKAQSELNIWYFPSLGEYTSLLEQAGFSIILAQYYDRPTILADQENGIIDWLTMFGSPFFENLKLAEQKEIMLAVQDKIRPNCFKNNKWIADYKRLRIVALKK